MPEQITEWEFVADVKSWIDQILAAEARLPFSGAKTEQRGQGSRKRRDLTLLDRNKRAALTGEFRFPWREGGSTPYNHQLLEDARRKAERARVLHFFTWNLNEFVLWETFHKNLPYLETKQQSWKVVRVTSGEQVTQTYVEKAVRRWLAVFLREFAGIHLGRKPLGILPLDDKFINEIEAFLATPIQLTTAELHERYVDKHFRYQLFRWMREEQGWTIAEDPQGLQDLLERAAKASCYGLVNRLVFYEALMKRYGESLEKLDIPEHIDTGERLETHLAGCFDAARIATRDYETVFPEELRDIGTRLPFLSDQAVPYWRELVNEIHRFDFSRLDYDVIGRMFERLIDPLERHKYGQYYTRPEVVDLINSFCIRTAEGTVLDPACGGGTFLVRAYHRKKCLSPSRRHRELLSELFGIDISPFATHLTTINLAIRDLVDEDNYPRVARHDFFSIKTGRRVMYLPTREHGASARSASLGKEQGRQITIPPLDAVVGNPPYLRQEDIRAGGARGGGAKEGTKEYYAHLALEEAQLRLSGRSDLHCYFWPHARTFLKDDGWFGFLTSSNWLDVEYGFRLQEWVLKNFAIVAIIESLDEPWFVGARVATAVTILRCERDTRKRMENVVRFVQLRAPIADVLASNGTACGPIATADALRVELMSVESDTVNERYRIRLVPQRRLWDNGVALGVTMGRADQDADKQNDNQTSMERADSSIQAGRYYGGKWGVYLRAPDLWFELLNETGGRWVPLGEIAEVRRGITSGKDCFFFVRDASAECLRKKPDRKRFERTFGVPRTKVQSGEVKLVRCGEGYGEIRPIESRYLQPEVHSLMELQRFIAAPDDCARHILLVSESKQELTGTYVLDYILWGEEKGWHLGATCSARVTQAREWFDLTGHRRGALFWPKAQQYRHLCVLNTRRLPCNCNLYDVHPENTVDPVSLSAVLNSTFGVLSKYQFGRPVGVEGNLKTEVVDVNMMLVPDPRRATPSQLGAVKRAFLTMTKRDVLDMLSEQRLRRMSYTQRGKQDRLSQLSDVSELDMPDRRALDDAVLSMLGIRSKKRREELLDRLYAYLREFFEDVRQKEEKAIENKKRAKRRRPPTPKQIAQEIVGRLQAEAPSWLRGFQDFIPEGTRCDTYVIPEKGQAELHSDLFMEYGVSIHLAGRKPIPVETRHLEQAKALLLAIDSGQRGPVRVPFTKQHCRAVIELYEDFVARRDAHFRDMIKERTADEEMQEQAIDVLRLLTKE